MEPVTTTLGKSLCNTSWARFMAPSVPTEPSSVSESPVTTMGSSWGGNASV